MPGLRWEAACQTCDRKTRLLRIAHDTGTQGIQEIYINALAHMPFHALMAWKGSAQLSAFTPGGRAWYSSLALAGSIAADPVGEQQALTLNVHQAARLNHKQVGELRQQGGSGGADLHLAWP